ncbi:glycosyltransferase 87 family protein [Microbacterium paludicola]|uniref:glycosyltransferase 87 family protein n=1 Tax=Microbacterium paludicola TaxID=300019 RepID=UPI0011A975C8|nr:glycosyltransferase 87 family protein [Microbacterium paludicola]
MKARVVGLWAAFLAVHVLVAWLGWVYPAQPMGDVTLVYQPWSQAALAGEAIVGVTESWVYPQPAIIPMLITQIVASPLTGVVGSAGAYLIGWAILVTALDAVGFGVLVGRTGTAARRSAGWFWTAALLLLGPIGMYRIDAVTVPLAVIGGCWLVKRPATAAVVLAVAAWIKIWPGALIVAAVTAARTRGRILLAFLGVSGVVILLLSVLGAGEHLFGFVTEQTGRGLQIEAVAATPFMWMAAAGAATVEYSFEILTFQIDAPGVDLLAAVLTPLMAVAGLAVVVLGVVKAVRGASFPRLLPPLAMAIVVVLIVTNKVGSPQFQTWLIAPVVLWILFDRTRSGAPAAVVLALCGLTCLVYPLTYDALLRAELLPVLVLTARNALLIVLLVLAVRALLRVPAVRSSKRK